MHEADLVQYYLENQSAVRHVRVHERTGNASIQYRGGEKAKMGIIRSLQELQLDDQKVELLLPDDTGRELNRQYESKLFWHVVGRLCTRFVLPAPLAHVITTARACFYVLKGIRALAGGHLPVEVLDATAIGVSVARRDFTTAGSVMFLLGVGTLLEEWTHKKSVADLARSMSLNIDRCWIRSGTEEIEIPVTQVHADDLVIVRKGMPIPLDGIVEEGEAMVNQAAMTGESMPVRKEPGLSVYAGTSIEEGELVIRVQATVGETRYEKIARMIEDGEKLKSNLETRASRLADRLVPASFLGTGLTWLLTRNVTKAISVLMVDFSCALKLSMPLAVLSAMREAGYHKITVKGGKFLEELAEASTIVFDKTGTLTKACPKVDRVVPFGPYSEEECLRLAACLEEHFPHSIATAVVREAAERGIVHDEMHSEVEYIVAHGIVSTVEGRRTVIGSYHFVFEDEGCVLPAGKEAEFDALREQYSHLYLAVGGELAAVIEIFDPLREEARTVVQSLRDAGFTKIVMMTGDSERTARAIAEEVGVDRYYAEVLPEDKARFIEEERAAGRKVVMVGDGINDSPALSKADIGIAIGDGAQIARDVADITIAAENLSELIIVRRLATLLMKRISRNYRFVVSFNFMLILLGVFGILAPGTSAMLHNGSTILIGLESMTDLL